MCTEEARRQLSAARKEYAARVKAILRTGLGEDQGVTTPSDLRLKPLYTPLDIEGTNHLRDLGFLGDYPFTR